MLLEFISVTDDRNHLPSVEVKVQHPSLFVSIVKLIPNEIRFLCGQRSNGRHMSKISPLNAGRTKRKKPARLGKLGIKDARGTECPRHQFRPSCCIGKAAQDATSRVPVLFLAAE